VAGNELRRANNSQQKIWPVRSVVVSCRDSNGRSKESICLVTGKLDRKALRPPDQIRPEAEGLFIVPGNPNEEVVAEVWSRVLGIEKVGIQDNFFGLGRHSLLAIQIMLRLSDRFRTLLPLRMLFDNPNVEPLTLEITDISIERAQRTERPLAAAATMTLRE
jgi:acyl carrier protein